MRFFRRGTPEGVTKADTGNKLSMYYNAELKRWVEPGQEHLIEEETKVAAPPKMGEVVKEEKKEPETPATGIDALLTVSAPTLSMMRPPTKKPSEGNEGPSMPPSIGGPFGGTVVQQANPNAPRGAFGGSGFGGGATVATNPNAPRNRDPKEKRERPKPAPRSSAFGGIQNTVGGPAYSAFPGIQPPKGGLGGLPPGVLPPGVKPPEPEPSAEESEKPDGDPEGVEEESSKQVDAVDPDPEGDTEGASKDEPAPEVSSRNDADPEGAPKDDIDPEGFTDDFIDPEGPTTDIVDSHEDKRGANANDDIDPEGSTNSLQQPSDNIDPEGFANEGTDPEGSTTNLVEGVSTSLAQEEAPEHVDPDSVAPEDVDTEGVTTTTQDPAQDTPNFGDDRGGEYVSDATEDVPVVKAEETQPEVSQTDFDDAFADDAFADMETIADKTAVAEVTVETAVVEDCIEELDSSEKVEDAPETKEPAPNESENADNGWGDDFDIDVDDVQPDPPAAVVEHQEAAPEEPPEVRPAEEEVETVVKTAVEVADDNGWGDFDDDNWGDDTTATNDAATQDVAPTEEIAKDIGVEETINTAETVAVEASDEGVDNKGAVTQEPEPSMSGNGESISSWVDVGEEYALTPPNPIAEEVPSVVEKPEEDTKAEIEPEKIDDEKVDDSEMRQELEALKEENAQLKRDLADREEVCRLAVDARSELDVKVNQLELDKVQLTTENSRMRTEVETLQSTESNLSSELSSRAQALKFRDDEIQSLTSKLQDSEARLAEVPEATPDTSAKLEDDLKEAQRKLAETEERLATALAAESKLAETEERLATALAAVPTHAEELITPRSPDRTSDTFNLPDFVWNCGNSQVMEYVEKLLSDNAELKRQAAKAPTSVDESGVSTEFVPTSQNFDAKDTDAEVAMAFASSISDCDGHQIQPLLALLVSHCDNAQVCCKVCEALETLTFTDAENRQTIVTNDGVEKILAVMEKHQDADADLIRPAGGALWNLTFDDVAVDRMTESPGLLERFFAVIVKRKEAADLQAGACAVLLNLAVKEQTRWKIVQLDGIAHMVAAMQQHSQCEEVLEQGCQALYMLAYHQEFKPIVQSKCGDAASLAASFPDGARAQKWGRWLQEVLAC